MSTFRTMLTRSARPARPTSPARTRRSLTRALDRNLTPSAREELLYLTLS